MNSRDPIERNLSSAVNAATAARTRYRDQALNWIALGVLLSAWQLEAQLDLEGEHQPEPRLALGKPAYTRNSQPLWNSEPRARSWIARTR
jgi:hypothetical protein